MQSCRSTKNILKTVLISVLSSTGSILTLVMISALILNTLQDPLSLIAPTAIFILLASSFICGFISFAAGKDILTSVITGVVWFFFVLTVFLIIPKKSTHSALYCIFLLLSLCFFVVLGAFLSRLRFSKKGRKRRPRNKR